jgi:hypothetical protein
MLLANPTVSSGQSYSPMNDFEYRHDRSQLGSGYYIYLSPPKYQEPLIRPLLYNQGLPTSK